MKKVGPVEIQICGKKLRIKEAFVAFVVVLVLATGFRLYDLGVPSFRADTIHFYNFCHQPLSGWTIFTRWMELMGPSSQLPFPAAVTKCFIDLLRLEPTAFVIRLPSALFGILTVGGMFALGRQMAGRSFGVLAALWLAVNPFHIQLSQEAYFYSPLLLGVTLQAWSSLWAYRHRNQRMPFPLRFHVLTQVGFLLMMYSHVSGWWVGALFAVFLGWILGRRAWWNPRGRLDFWSWLVMSILIGLPLMFLDWGLPYFLKEALSPASKDKVKQIFGERQTPLVSFTWLLLKSASWGATTVRVGFLAITMCLTIAVLVFNRRRSRRAWLVVLFLLGGFFVYCLSLITTGTYYAQRHVAYLLPLYLCIMAYGVWHVSAFPGMHRFSPLWRRIPAYGMAAMAVALSVQPAWWSTQLTGKPTPYKEIAHWCDTQLPPRTLVLVERWFDPWNELRVHNSTNVYFTFTVPSEPEDVFERYHWPETAKQFFEHFPDAAFLEYNSSERQRMGVVSNVFFARHVVFTNKAGIQLAKYGVAYRDEFYDSCTNKLICTLFYNTREDVLQHARQQGKTTLVLYGPTWGYIKPWQQLQDFRDWRVLEGRATLDLYNLSSQPMTVTVRFSGMAAGGTKRVRIGTQTFHLDPNRPTEWKLAPITLQPGLNTLVWQDALWGRGAQIPLLVDRISVDEMEGSVQSSPITVESQRSL